MIEKYTVEGQEAWILFSLRISKYTLTPVLSKIGKKLDSAIWLTPGIYITDDTLKETKVIGARFLRYNLGLTILERGSENESRTEELSIEDSMTTNALLSLWLSGNKITLVTTSVKKCQNGAMWIFPGLYYAPNEDDTLKCLGIRFLRRGAALLINNVLKRQANEAQN
jgi:hypothetical protein